MMVKSNIALILKGAAMGAANVIPGVSGGTIALITGIFERLINAVKSINLMAARLLIGGRLKDFARHTDLVFLVMVFAGILLAIVTLARLFDYLFTHYPVYIWAYFFGLVLASIYFVGKSVSKWTISVILTFIAGTAVAVIVSVLNPAAENDGFLYLMLCGAVAICSMILPGLSGSFVLILMGNYRLVAIEAINNRDFDILLPVIVGAAAGLVVFSHLLSWIFKKYRDETISLLTGFIMGSLSILWPWQRMNYLRDESGDIILKNGEPVVESYVRYFPESFSTEAMLAMVFALTGILSIWFIEKTAEQKSKD